MVSRAHDSRRTISSHLFEAWHVACLGKPVTGARRAVISRPDTEALLRQFRDEDGVVWEAWEVSAASLHDLSSGGCVEPELEEGWLCFLSGAEKRRLVSYPGGWQYLPERTLVELCGRAQRVLRPGGAVELPREGAGLWASGAQWMDEHS